ncbi:unnamed protein product [Moneuplotes crassus]|uniref:Protein YIPF n=1 Tax=Euplotes crassus TaxID=5936 RepID=A0AAD1XMT6_EUPCR|nr:unnamed protein product [Moneuplotes crassus]
MADSPLGAYQPPVVEANRPREQVPKKEDDEFNLLDIDFNNYDQSESDVNLDSSLSDKKQDNPVIADEDIQPDNGKFGNRPHGDQEEDINMNQPSDSLINPNRQNMADMEANEPKIVENRSFLRYFTVEYYKEYFDVTTQEVVSRLIRSCIPLYPGSIYDNGKVDLYGPIWIVISLNIAITVFGNIARYVSFDSKDEDVKYTSHLEGLVKSVPVITLYFVCMPAFLNIFLNFTGVQYVGKITFKLVSIYGYSFASFIPAIFLYMASAPVLPHKAFNSFEWLILFAAGFISLFFMFKEMVQVLRNNIEEVKVAAAVVCLGHLILILMMKWKFLS